MDTEIKNRIPFVITQKKMKYLGIIPAIQDFCAESYTMLRKEMKEHLNKGRDMTCLWIGRQH